MRRAAWLVVNAAGQWAMVDDEGRERSGEGELVCLQETYTEPRDIFLWESAQLVQLLSSVPAKGRPDSAIIRERDGYTTDCAGFAWTHGASYWLGAMAFPEPVTDYCRSARWPRLLAGSLAEQARIWRDIHRAQTELTKQLAGVEPSHSLSSTAVKAVLPREWRRGADYLAQNELVKCVRSACYGGRIECYETGWSGPAVEYDINSAYGWALTQPLPDWQLYDRRAYAGEAEWLDCTVKVRGPVGPLPHRQDNDTASLSWPANQTFRGWWSAIELEKSAVKVLRVHRRIAGRMSLDLSRPVSRLLDIRAGSSDYATRATVRAMAVGLAGKLWQRPARWGLWHLNEGPAPDGATQLGQTEWMVYPVQHPRKVLSLPSTASWVTSLVRAKLWPYIASGDAVYCHTDSVHLPQSVVDAGLCPQTGTDPGLWSVKGRGEAMYHGVNHYRIGAKFVKPSGLTRKVR